MNDPSPRQRRLIRRTAFIGLIALTGFLLGVAPTPQRGGLPAADAADLTDPVIAAAGDIACDPLNSNFKGGLGTSNSCRQKYTSDLLVNAGLSAVLDLGDNQYYCGGYQAFLNSYDLSWGRVKSITHPSVGNHEYLTSSGSDRTGCDSSNLGGAGYFKYFGDAAGTKGQGWYSYDVGAWHLIALNSNCGDAGGCGSTSPQGIWLRNDLAAHPNYCTLAYWHIPLFSSGGRASNNSKSFWDALYAADADVVLNGHDHIYERFAPQTPAGVADAARGIREFIVGTGGSDHTSITKVAANSVVRNTTSYGVLKLTLHSMSYDWQFVPEIGGSFTESGTGQCHGVQTDFTAPTAPTGLTATATSPGSVDLSWQPSTDDVGVTGYRVFRSGVQIATTSGTSFTDNTVTPATSYDYTLTAIDAAGNQSAPSAPATVLTPPDTTAPSTPTGLATTSVGPQDVRLSWTASTDDVRVASYDVLRDGVVIGSATSAAYDDATVQPTTTYSYSVVAVDAAGNRSTASDPLSVTTPAAPTVLTLPLTADSYVGSDFPTGINGKAATIQVDGSPVKHIFLRFDVSGVSGRTVTSAKLRVYCVDPSDVGGVLHQVTGTWSESTLTWNNQPTYSSLVVSRLGTVSTGNWYEFDLTGLVTGDGTYDLAVDTTSSNGADYSSREATTNPPQVVVTTTN